MKYQNSPYPCHHYQKATDNHGNHKIHSCDALPDLVSFVQFKKREKHSWRSVNFSKVAGCFHGCFSRFLNCTNGTQNKIKPEKRQILILCVVT